MSAEERVTSMNLILFFTLFLRVACYTLFIYKQHFNKQYQTEIGKN